MIWYENISSIELWSLDLQTQSTMLKLNLALAHMPTSYRTIAIYHPIHQMKFLFSSLCMLFNLVEILSNIYKQLFILYSCHHKCSHMLSYLMTIAYFLLRSQWEPLLNKFQAVDNFTYEYFQEYIYIQKMCCLHPMMHTILYLIHIMPCITFHIIRIYKPIGYKANMCFPTHRIWVRKKSLSIFSLSSSHKISYGS